MKTYNGCFQTETHLETFQKYPDIQLLSEIIRYINKSAPHPFIDCPVASTTTYPAVRPNNFPFILKLNREKKNRKIKNNKQDDWTI